FYRFHPVTLRRIRGTDDELAARPPVRRVQIKDMLHPATFARYRLRVLRLHYQFVMANERRASYDYFMMICGPLLKKAWTTSPLGQQRPADHHEVIIRSATFVGHHELIVKAQNAKS